MTTSTSEDAKPGEVEDARKLLAMMAVIRDLRTLDDWRAVSPERTWLMSGDGWAWCRLYDHGAKACQRGFDGPTPDEARAKAAAWIRGQK